MTKHLVVFAAIAVVVSSASAATDQSFPKRIDLPDGLQPEGIAAAGERFFTGSLETGAVQRKPAHRRGALLVQPQTGRVAVGMKHDRGRLFVAGGMTGQRVRLRREHRPRHASYRLSRGGLRQRRRRHEDRCLVHRLVQARLYRVPLGAGGRPGAPSAVKTVRLTGAYRQASGFNVNGIDATPNGTTLVIVQSGTGKLFTVTPAGVARPITLAGGGQSVPNGDGIVLAGRTLYVVQNQLNVVAKIAVASNSVERAHRAPDLEPGLRRSDDSRAPGQPALRRERALRHDLRLRRPTTGSRKSRNER